MIEVEDLYSEGITCFTLGMFCGIDNATRDKENGTKQAMKMFVHCGVVPSRDQQNVQCPVCNNPHIRNVPLVFMRTVSDHTRDGWRFRCPSGHKRSRLAGTFLEHARFTDVGGSKLLKVMFCWLTGLPQKDCHQQVGGCTTDTIVAWYSHCRDIARKIAWHDFRQIGDEHDIVEVDETLYYKWRLTQWCFFGGISRTTHQRFGVLVENLDEDTLLPIMQRFIDSNSMIFSDEHEAYDRVQEAFGGHMTVNHSRCFVWPPEDEDPLWAPRGRFHPNCLETFIGPPPQGMEQPYRVFTNTYGRSWKDFKEMLGTLNDIKLADAYIGEWMYRRNILDPLPNLTARFDRFLRDVARAYPGLRGKKMQADIYKCDCHECDP